MSGSLAVFKLTNINKSRLMKKELESDSQSTFADFDLGDCLGKSKSTLNFRNYDETNERINYEATHFSDTIATPIRFYLDDIDELFSSSESINNDQISRGTHIVNEYQEIHKFDVLIDLKSQEIFVFANKKISNAFMKRFKKSGYLKYEKIFFDMSKIDNIPELSNIWGLWEDCTGRCRKKAYFGTELHKIEGLDKKGVTSYNVNYLVDEENNVDFSIMSDCRLSSRSKMVTNVELFETYQAIKKHIGFTDRPEYLIEASEEDD